MIIGKDFIWLHFPKCAGSLTEKILRNYFLCDPTISFDPINPTNVIWHQSVIQRETLLNKSLSDKDVICNFRRLPDWIISRIGYEAQRSDHIVSRQMMIQGCFYEYNGDKNSADQYILRYTSRDVKHWIRVEYIVTDFYKAFHSYLNVKQFVSPSDFRQKVNVTDHKIKESYHFTPEEIRLLYSANPLWASLELKLYGCLMI